MLLRIWRTSFDRARLDELQRFADDISSGMFRELEGCLGYSYANRGSEWLTITRWTSQEAIDRAEKSALYQAVVDDIVSRGFLGDTQTTEVYELTSARDFD